MIEVSERGVSRDLGDGRAESVTWAGLLEVRIITTSRGPFQDDVFFVLGGGEAGVVVPQGEMTDDLLARLQALPGFDNEKLIEAMGCTDDADFLCWERPSEPA